MSGNERGQAAPEPRRLAVETIFVTCCLDDRAHVVPDTEFAVRASRRGGYYQALCGHMIAAAPMVMPDGEPCQLCAAIRNRNPKRRRHRRLRRLLGR